MNDLVSYQLDSNESSTPIATITLDDGKANALSTTMINAINEALNKAEADQAVVIITGREGRLTGGFDLKVMSTGVVDDIMKMLKGGADLAERLMNHPFPIIMASTGHCMAMGALLLLSADYRIGSQGQFKIGLNETTIGLVMPPFGCEIVRYAMSHQHFKRSLIQAEVCDPEKAISFGFLDEAVAADQLASRALEKAKELAMLDMPTFKEIKLIGREAARNALRTAIEQGFSE